MCRESSENGINFDVEYAAARYCICRRGRDTAMIACHNPRRDLKLFHFNCVRIDSDFSGPWFCEWCRYHGEDEDFPREEGVSGRNWTPSQSIISDDIEQYNNLHSSGEQNNENEPTWANEIADDLPGDVQWWTIPEQSGAKVSLRPNLQCSPVTGQLKGLQRRTYRAEALDDERFHVFREITNANFR